MFKLNKYSCFAQVASGGHGTHRRLGRVLQIVGYGAWVLWGAPGFLSAKTTFLPPPAPCAEDVELAVKRNHAADGTRARPLLIVLLADRKDHGNAGNNEHDYPLWQERWALWLGGRGASSAQQVNLYGPLIDDIKMFDGAEKVRVERAWGWPSDEQFKSADVIVAYCYLSWNDIRKQQIAKYLGRGGGLVCLHSATWTKPQADEAVVALCGVGGFKCYRHGEVAMERAAAHPISRDLPQVLQLCDESYWPLTPSAEVARVSVLATCNEKLDDKALMATPQALFWIYEQGRGRVFSCVLGHYAWTFDDPWFRLWVRD